jgi:hypothetical protein
MSNKELYEQIMQHVAKVVKETLNNLDECECGGDACPGGDFGGVTAPYSTPLNTIGVGDIVPAGVNTYGSGDRFDYGNTIPKKKKSSKKKNRKKENTIFNTLAVKKTY